MDTLPPFPGFRLEAIQFLRDLAQNNERDWFKPRKPTYDDEIKWPFMCLIADATRQAQGAGLTLSGNPKKSMFRIYRDTRFSKNKAPYKTHVSGVLSRSGGKKDPGGIYIHIEPDNVFLAAGYWQPEADLLRSWRTRMSDDVNEFMQLVQHLSGAGLILKPHNEPLKRMPRGFESHADTSIAEYLKWKSFIVVRELAEDVILEPAFAHTVLGMMQDTYPLLEYGWAMIEDGY